MNQKIGVGLIEHEKAIWSTADTLRGAGIKESDFPSYMMPFFALMMLESRLRRFKAEKLAEFEKAMGVAFDPDEENHAEWLDSSVKAAGKGYHSELVRYGKGLKETCLVPGGNFLNRLMTHLNLYDPETKRLLGVGYAPGTAKFLDIQGKASDLFSRPNSPLYAFAQKWAAIDLTQLDNSEITTIEEHIKRKWADISAETAGEQYTPSDVIDLATALIVELMRESGNEEGIADVYDMACGGGNFLFAAEDSLREAFPKLSVRSRGQELNDALFALSAIEARFREDAKIEWGNTLTNDLFLSEKADAIVANPPYGLDWKDFKAMVEADASGRFSSTRMPPTSDGQLLFLQHAAFHLSDRGVATIVHSGSTLFSGDAGGGESETRKWLLKELDIVEAIVQLPKNEFFNTGISTYLWVLNRGKPEARKGKVLLINAESCFTKLQKNLNQKSCEIDEANRQRVVQAFREGKDGPISKVMTVDDLLYNKVEIELHRHDENGLAIQSETALKADELLISIDDVGFSVKQGILEVGEPNGKTAKEIAAAFNEAAKNSERTAVNLGSGESYVRDNESGSVWRQEPDGEKPLGTGTLSVKAKVAKAKGTEIIKVEAFLGPLLEKDTETIGYSSDPNCNEGMIDAFLKKWVREPWKILGVKVGAEINFNRLFPKTSEMSSSAEILAKLGAINSELVALETEFAKGIV